MSHTIPIQSILTQSLTPKELARRWRCRPAFVRELIRSGQLLAILIKGRPRITPEAIRVAELGLLAVRPAVSRGRKREMIPKEVADLLSDKPT